jgi:hypothetical protein
VRLLRRKRRLDLAQALSRGWVSLRDGAYAFDVDVYYVRPPQQAHQLAQAGLELVEVLGADGGRVDSERPGRDLLLHYLCRPLARR